MKKLVAWAIVLILCLSISGCGNSNGKADDVNSVVRSHNYKEDVIKFDDIEWLTEFSEVEKKINEDLLTTTEIDRKESIQGTREKFGYDYDIGTIFLQHKELDKKTLNKSIGKLAEWDILSLSIQFIEYKDIKYVYGYSIMIMDLEKKYEIWQIKNNIEKKLDIKYSIEKKKKRDESENVLYDYMWEDDNNNRIVIQDMGDEVVSIQYYCNDINDKNSKSTDEYINKELSENSKGL